MQSPILGFSSTSFCKSWMSCRRVLTRLYGPWGGRGMYGSLLAGLVALGITTSLTVATVSIVVRTLGAMPFLHSITILVNLATTVGASTRNNELGGGEARGPRLEGHGRIIWWAWGKSRSRQSANVVQNHPQGERHQISWLVERQLDS